MAELHFKRLTTDNFQQPDPTLSVFVRLSPQDGSIRTLGADEWAQEILAVELSERVPLEVQRLFAVARGAFVYGYFFYPLYTLGMEQLFRLAETAVNLKCRDVGVSEKRLRKLSFRERVERLVRKGVIQPSAQPGWEALWKLRIFTSHPEEQMILPPGVTISELRRIADDIDGMFAK